MANTTNTLSNTPQAKDDVFTGGENNQVVLDVMSNDLGGAGKKLYSLNQADPAVAATSGVSQLGAQVSIVNGKVVYAADSAALNALGVGQTAVDTFTYVIQLGNGALSIATVKVTVTGTNDAPVVSGAVVGSAAEDGPGVTLNALANASDVDAGTSLTVVGVPASLPAGVTYDAAAKTFTLNPAAAAYQSLAAGQQITVTISYGVSDGVATTPATASWTVTGANDAPVVSGAVIGAASEDGAGVTLNALANASDIDTGAVLSVVAPGTLPAGVSFDAAAKTFTLDPTVAAYQSLAAGQQVVVTVNYGVSDGTVTTPATATWTVTGANDAPVVSGAVTGHATEDGPGVTLGALANAGDVDAGTVLVVVEPASLPAGVTFNAAAKTLTLDPTDAAYQGLAAGQQVTVTVDYGVSDGLVTTPATASWIVTGVNDAPVANANQASVAEDVPLILDVLANDTDADVGAVLSLISVQAPSGKGVATVVDGKVQYDQGAAFNHLAAGAQEVVTLTYVVRDETGAQSTATVDVTVVGVNDPAVVTGPILSGAFEGGPAVTVNGLANASDVDDGAVLTITNVLGALPPGVTFNAATQSFTLDPTAAAYNSLAPGQTVPISVHYQVSDGTYTTPASITWQLTGTNDAPVAQAIPDMSVGLLTPFSYTLPANAFTDPDNGASLTYSVSGFPSWMTYNPATKTFSGQPQGPNIGASDITVVATDQYGASTSETFKVTVVDQPVFASGPGEGHDSFHAGSFADTLLGNGGSDTLTGAGGSDSLNGGTGADRIYGDDQAAGAAQGLTAVAAGYYAAGNAMIRTLGGATGFGENVLPAGDDNYLSVNVASVFPNALNFFGNAFSTLFVNNNGSISFGAGVDAYVATAISSGATKIIAPFWADVDTRNQGGATTVTAGGASLGTNNVYYDLDAVNRVFTVTWDDVGRYNQVNNPANAFQLQLIDRGSGDFDIIFRYEAINWLTGDASGGALPRAGYTAGDGVNYFELAGSATSAAGTWDTTAGNAGLTGVYQFQVRNGAIVQNNDTITGGAGADTLTGGLGADRFVFGSAAEGVDEITDFTNGYDDIQVSAAGFGGGLTVGGTVQLVLGAPGVVSGGAGGYFIFNPNNSQLFWDPTGGASSDAQMVAKLTGVSTLFASDFVVV